MQSEHSKAYMRGYSAGSSKKWPAHRPPHPPNELVAQLMRAAEKLRDEADDICSILLPDDEFVTKLSPGIDDVNTALKAVTQWLLDQKPNAEITKA